MAKISTIKKLIKALPVFVPAKSFVYRVLLLLILTVTCAIEAVSADADVAAVPIIDDAQHHFGQ